MNQFAFAHHGNAMSWHRCLTALLMLSFFSFTCALHAEEQQITIGTLHGQLKYDIDRFQVKPDATVKLTLKNTDEMQHNLVILTPGDGVTLAVAQKAWALGAEAVKKEFVPDTPEVLFYTKVVNPQQSDTITFTAPNKEGDYPFVCTLPGHAFSMKGIMRVNKVAAEPVKAEVEKGKHNTTHHLHAMEEPLVVRAFIDGGPPRSICVGLPVGVNYLFDSEACYVRFGWTGMFLDVGPNVVSRGGGWCKILGDKFELGDSGFPISVGGRDVKHIVKFGGYRMRGKDVPQFLFTIDDFQVTQTIQPAAKGIGLTMEYEFDRDPGDVYYYVSPNGLDLSSSAGTWQSGRLDLPAGSAKKFSVTITRETKASREAKAKAVTP